MTSDLRQEAPEEVRSSLQFTVRRNAALFGILGLAAAGLSGAFLVRGDGALDTVLGLGLATVAVVHLFALIGARQPLLLADGSAIRLRVANGWQRLPWAAVRQVVVEQPDSALRDGRIVVLPRDPELAADLGVLGRIHTVWSRRWYGAPLSVPLAMTTTTSGADVVADLKELADGRTEVVELHGRHLASLAEVPARLGALVSRMGRGQSHDVDTDFDWEDGDQSDSAESVASWMAGLRLRPRGSDADPASEVEDTGPLGGPEDTTVLDEPVAPPVAPPVSPLREPARPTRSQVTRSIPASPGQGNSQGNSQANGEHAGQPVETPSAPLVFDDTAVTPGRHQAAVAAPDPVIGPVLRQARERVRLSIEELSERTRIRPHVLEGMERDDFEPCGGDFYARGHLTTLARALGLDLAPLMRDYEERYAHGPINARRVFEAELATGLSGGMRATVGGPRWSLLVVTVLCLMLVWGVARLFTDAPEEVALQEPGVSAGLATNREPITSPKMKTRTMTATAAFASAHVVVKDRTGKVLWSGDLAQGDHRKVAGLAPFTVESDNAGAVEVKVMGKPLGTLGMAGAPGSKKFG